MPDFWQFATVSMGLGPLMAIYQARFMRYMIDRGFMEDTAERFLHFLVMEKWMNQNQKGANTCLQRELDNLVFVVNCNLQR